MKKQNLKSLKLNKNSIAMISDTAKIKGGIGSFSDLLRCHFDPIGTPLEPINVDSWGSCHPCSTIYGC